MHRAKPLAFIHFYDAVRLEPLRASGLRTKLDLLSSRSTPQPVRKLASSQKFLSSSFMIHPIVHFPSIIFAADYTSQRVCPIHKIVYCCSSQFSYLLFPSAERTAAKT